MKKNFEKFIVLLIALTLKAGELAIYPFIIGYIGWSMLGFKLLTGFGVGLLVIAFIRLVKDELGKGAIKK